MTKVSSDASLSCKALTVTVIGMFHVSGMNVIDPDVSIDGFCG